MWLQLTLLQHKPLLGNSPQQLNLCSMPSSKDSVFDLDDFIVNDAAVVHLKWAHRPSADQL